MATRGTIKPALVVLAAGLGRRYGKLKQLEPVGPAGATMIEYTLYDATRAGFERVVLIVRPETESAFQATLSERLRDHVPIEYAFQRLDDLPPGITAPPGRTRPWGTAQAVLAAEQLIDEPFAVVNADDLYGRDAFGSLAAFLRRQAGTESPTYAMVGYPLGRTLADAGPVSRAICECDADGWLRDIVETTGIEKHGAHGRLVGHDGEARTIAGDVLVSMNMWGFSRAVFEQLRERFHDFLDRFSHSTEGEFLLPSVIGDLIRRNRCHVKVLKGGDAWCGVTNPQDSARVSTWIRDMIAGGHYPQELWV